MPATGIDESEATIAFLDHRPLFPGHTLVIPRARVETLRDLPDELVGPLFADVRRSAVAVQDGLRGFFWPRNPYADEAHMAATAARIRSALRSL